MRTNSSQQADGDNFSRQAQNETDKIPSTGKGKEATYFHFEIGKFKPILLSLNDYLRACN